jgi:hypothetical protein
MAAAMSSAMPLSSGQGDHDGEQCIPPASLQDWPGVEKGFTRKAESGIVSLLKRMEETLSPWTIGPEAFYSIASSSLRASHALFRPFSDAATWVITPARRIGN